MRAISNDVWNRLVDIMNEGHAVLSQCSGNGILGTLYSKIGQGSVLYTCYAQLVLATFVLSVSASVSPILVNNLETKSI